MATRLDNVKAVLDAPRNGANSLIRYNPLVPRFVISDGVKELADTAGCYWLLDILAMELEPIVLSGIRQDKFAAAYVEMFVTGSTANIVATSTSGPPPIWTRKIDLTDFPEGEWALFEIGALEWDAEGRARNLVCILTSEH